MDSIKLKFRASSKPGKHGVLFFQIIHDRTVRRVTIGHRIFSGEWCDDSETILLPDSASNRYAHVKAVMQHCEWEIERFHIISKAFGTRKYSVEELVDAFRTDSANGKSFFGFLQRKSSELRDVGRDRCSETMICSLRSFMQFRGGIDIDVDKITKEMMARYEAYMLKNGLRRNTTSFYMRNLRSAYKVAVEEGLTIDNNVFCRVYTGVDKTIKRAIGIGDIRKIRRLPLGTRPALEYARDMLMLCFYLRGISFIDLAFLRKKDVKGGRIVYGRRKTKKLLTVQIPPEADALFSKYPSDTQYLLPIIKTEDGSEREQYRRQLMAINRNLKKVGRMVQLPIPLSTYVMRHSWATIAHNKGIEIAVISEGLGHENELTTQIYLDSINTAEVDEANRKILDDL